MKKLFVLATIAGFIFTSCGPKKDEAKNEEQDVYSEHEMPGAEAEDAGDGADKAPLSDLIAQGEALINSSDCKTCHTVENRIVGPSYNDVAGKYPFNQENVAFLSEKVISGGAGNWGDIPMTAHVDLSKPEAEKMVYYILSLDGEEYQE